MKRRTFKVLVILLCFVLVNTAFADIEITDESKYGKGIYYSTNSAYPGDINIDGVYVYQDDSEYVFTILYSGGELVKVNNGGNPKVKTSFFNPPSGDIVMMSWGGNFDKVTEGNNSIQYHVDKESFTQVDGITVFLYDVNHNDDDMNMSVYFKTDHIDLGKIPDVDSLFIGYEINSNDVASNLTSTPSLLAEKNIEELQIEGIFREEAFSNFSEGVTRGRFVYLMVTLYEEFTGTTLAYDRSISFEDSVDPYALKAATLGITSGIGNNKFGPDILLNREEMTTLIIKTLNVANVELNNSDGYKNFEDDNEISEWAKDYIYTAQINGIVSGLGENLFSPKAIATNEEVLNITHEILKKYVSLEWLQESEGSRVYYKFNDDLYQIPFGSNIIVNESTDDTKLYLKTSEDVNTFINTLLLKTKNLSYVKSSNPNFKGKLKEHDYKEMKVFAENVFSGVDKIGETITYNFDDGSFISKVTHKFENETFKYKNFDTLRYYDLDNERHTMETLPIQEIAEALGVEYKISFDSTWDIYIVELVSE